MKKIALLIAGLMLVPAVAFAQTKLAGKTNCCKTLKCKTCKTVKVCSRKCLQGCNKKVALMCKKRASSCLKRCSQLKCPSTCVAGCKRRCMKGYQICRVRGAKMCKSRCCKARKLCKIGKKRCCYRRICPLVQVKRIKAPCPKIRICRCVKPVRCTTCR